MGRSWIVAALGVLALVGLALLGWRLLQPSAGPPAPPEPESIAYLCDKRPSDPDWQVTAAFCAMESRTIRVVNARGETLELVARIADEPREMAAGYQDIGPEVIARTLILFVFPAEAQGPFHMCNVRAPLDIAWFRADGTLVETQRMEPGPQRPAAGCPALYAPAGRYRFALEAPAGFFAEQDLAAEARLVVEAWMR